MDISNRQPRHFTMSNMQRYLAEKYMSGPKADAILARDAPKKKKKRKQGAVSSGSGSVGIVDEDASWAAPVDQNEDEDEVEAVVASDRTFKKRRRVADDGGWVSLPPPGADSINQQPEEAEDEKPVVVVEPEAPKKSGGLLSHAELWKKLGTDVSTTSTDAKPTPEQMETVYRDASGRKIDTKAAKAEAARQKREQEEQEAKRMQWGKGIVQRQEAQDKRREMELERGRGFERRRDDEALNAMQKEEMRWNDPAAAFLSKPQTKGPKKPEYKGPPPPPNRFGIKPGYRWDGVDRSNGFEKKYFQRLNERQRVGQEAYQWSVDDM